MYTQNLQGYPLAFSTPLCQYVVMVCIYCGSKTQVTNSRLQKQANNVWRRRVCLSCRGAFTTHEQADLASSFVVAMSEKDVEPFSRDILLISIYESCKHREDALTDAGALTQTVINKLIPASRNSLLDREAIVAVTRETLMRFDMTAATIYDAYHKPQKRDQEP